jgi:hypothetical protein
MNGPALVLLSKQIIIVRWLINNMYKMKIRTSDLHSERLSAMTVAHKIYNHLRDKVSIYISICIYGIIISLIDSDLPDIVDIANNYPITHWFVRIMVLYVHVVYGGTIIGISLCGYTSAS